MANLHANGKLLLTGEYFVLDGAKALALPCQLGQWFSFVSTRNPTVEWLSLDQERKPWFKGRFAWPSGEYLEGTDPAVGERVQQILKAVRATSGAFQDHGAKGWEIKTRLDFPRYWGLGSSSTLIACVARWKGINPYKLLQDTFGGSGYDIACANADGPILYRRKEPKPVVSYIDFAPSFRDRLYFVYLGKKQNSREGIKRYREGAKTTPDEIKRMNKLTFQFSEAETLEEFNELIREHEAMVGKKIKLERAKTLHFSDFWGEIKSLGAWGGDFVLATSSREPEETIGYFHTKGYTDVFKYEDLILQETLSS